MKGGYGRSPNSDRRSNTYIVNPFTHSPLEAWMCEACAVVAYIDRSALTQRVHVRICAERSLHVNVAVNNSLKAYMCHIVIHIPINTTLHKDFPTPADICMSSQCGLTLTSLCVCGTQ